MIVLDASVLIGFLDADDAHHARSERLLADHIDEELAVSALTLAEVLVGPVRAGRAEAVEDAIQALEIRAMGLSPDSGRQLAELRAFHALAMPDCCVLLTALAEGAAVATFDERLASAASRSGMRVLGVAVPRPPS